MASLIRKINVWFKSNDLEINIMWADCVASAFNYLSDKKSFKLFTMPTVSATTKLAEFRN